MEAMKNVPSAHVSDFKLLKEFHLVFGICYKIHSLQELSINEGEYHKKKTQFWLVLLGVQLLYINTGQMTSSRINGGNGAFLYFGFDLGV